MRGNVTGDQPDGGKVDIPLEGASMENVLMKDFGEKGSEHEKRVSTFVFGTAYW
jgi:hypothetical protein